MTTKVPNRKDLTELLAAINTEPEGPDRAAAIEIIQTQLESLDELDLPTDPDLDEPDHEPF